MQSNPAPHPIELKVRRLRQLQKDGGHTDVLSQLAPLLSNLPENRDLLLIEAVSLRHLLRIDEALAALERMERLHPRFSRLHQERGMCHVSRKDAPAAIDALLRAVNINPALPSSWSMLQGLYRLTGDVANAQTCADHVATLKHLPPDVVSATALYSDGDLAPAEQIIRAFLLRHGDHPEAMRLLAKIGIAQDVLDDAELLLEAALAFAPDHQPIRYDYAQTLLQRHKFRLAQDQADRLLAVDPRNLDYRALAATAAVGLGEHDAAIALYRDMLVDAPDAPDLHLWLAHALKTVGQTPEAVDSYRWAAVLRPDFGDAYWSLANLKMYRFTDQEIERMRAEEASPTVAPVDRYHLCFAMGKALEHRADPAQSWLYYERGNALKRAESRYDPTVLEANTAQQIKICTKDFFQRRAGWGAARRDPIFIVGLPRSGSTLLEQILASHSQVEGTQELSNIQSLVLELQGRDNDPADPRYPSVLTQMSAQDFQRLGEKYLADTRVYRTGKPFFIDKMPNNFRHIGLIHLILPNAKIVDARRDPMSCCFSNLKQLFAQGQEFSYSIDDISRYYDTYLDLMQHWDAALPGRILRVQHQDVVSDLTGSVRRLLDYCELPFEEACIDFHNTQRSVRTPSSEQVRTPIFRDGLDQWKMYQPWLRSLQDALDGAQARYRTAD